MEDFEFLDYKPGLIKIAEKRCKFGLVKRSGATLRRNSGTNNHTLHGGCHRNGAAIVKHISSTNQWKPKHVQESFDIDDGGMLSSKSFSKVPSRRGKGVLSPIAGKSDWNGNVIYSMNKKKRWLLPDLLRDEVYREMNKESNPVLDDIDLTIIEREIGTNGNLCMYYFSSTQVPDTVNVTSSIKSFTEDDFRLNCRRSKRKKYGWSTDMMGLSQKIEKNDDMDEENLKPQVTYEICRPRSPSQYPNFVAQPTYSCFEDSRRSRTKTKRELIRLYKDSEDNLKHYKLEATAQESENDFEAMPSECKSPSLSIGSWIVDATKRSGFSHHRKRRGRNCSKSACVTTSSMKGRVVFEPVVQNEPSLHSDVNPSGVTDTYLERIQKSELKNSTELSVSLKSLKELETLFKEPQENESKIQNIHGVDVVRGESLPLKYAFQMNEQIDVTSEMGKMESATYHLILESVRDPNQCFNQEKCHLKSGLCACHSYVPVRLKTLSLSDVPGHQTIVDIWREKLKAELARDEIDSKRFSLEEVIEIAKNSLNSTAEANTTVGGQASKLKVSALKSSPYVRSVTKAAVALLGFATNRIAESEVSHQLKERHCEDDVEHNHSSIANMTRLDYCEICCAVLSEEREDGPLASAMTACNHWFCTNCWRHHLATAACNAAATSAQCPGFQCDVKIDDVTLMTLLPGDVIATYRNRQVSNAVKRSEEYQQCPGCSYLIEVTLPMNFKARGNGAPLSCACGARWCTGCRGEPHWPATCESAALYWEELHKQSKARYPNIVTSVSGRKCPECREPIEKDGGCQMVTCICGNTFCWYCMEPMKGCWYRCKGQDDTSLETWDIDSLSSKFIEGVKEASLFSHRYHAFKQHKLRVGLCRVTASKWVAYHHPGATFNEIVEMTKETEIELENCLLICDSLYHIMQYVAVCISTRQPPSKHHCSKLNRFLSRLKSLAANIEHILFHFNPHYHRKVSPVQRAKKQIESAKLLVKFLQNFVRKCAFR